MAVKPPEQSAAEKALIAAQARGEARNGTVDLRVFDEGVVLTLGAELVDSDYWIQLPDVKVPTDLKGIPVTFAYPDDIIEKYRVPAVVIRRDDIYPAMQRWHPGQINYRVPAPSALPVTVTLPGGVTKSGFTHYEERNQAMPFDIMYTINIISRFRGGPGGVTGLKNQANRVLTYVLQKFPPYGRLVVKDQQGNQRTYEAFMEGVGIVDSTPEVSYRLSGFSVTLRIEAELDLDEVREYTAVTGVNKTLVPIKR